MKGPCNLVLKMWLSLDDHSLGMGIRWDEGLVKPFITLIVAEQITNRQIKTQVRGISLVLFFSSGKGPDASFHDSIDIYTITR
jgi:hypothetical protein